MKTLRQNNQGFTMVELLVVLVIIGILAAVATPIFLGNTQKAKASEAVATMSLIRQVQRDYYINNNEYLVDIKDISLPAKKNGGVGVNAGITQYFSNDAFSVVSADKAAAPFKDVGNKTAQDFVVRVDGSKSAECKTNDGDASEDQKSCAVKLDNDIKNFKLEMDNTGRVFVSYNGTDWQKY